MLLLFSNCKLIMLVLFLNDRKVTREIRHMDNKHRKGITPISLKLSSSSDIVELAISLSLSWFFFFFFFPPCVLCRSLFFPLNVQSQVKHKQELEKNKRNLNCLIASPALSEGCSSQYYYVIIIYTCVCVCMSVGVRH